MHVTEQILFKIFTPEAFFSRYSPSCRTFLIYSLEALPFQLKYYMENLLFSLQLFLAYSVGEVPLLQPGVPIPF
jgi:hypothetical protein